MQTLKVIALLIIFGFLFIGNAQSQTRQYNESYTYTVFVDHFSGTNLDRTRWRVENGYKRDLGLLKDTPATLRVQNDNLELTMISCPNCTAGSYQGNYAGAEVASLVSFPYGIFECRAKYAQGDGSWPAFWMIGGDGTACPPGGYANEIDIAENFCGGISDVLEHNIHHYHPPTDCAHSEFHTVDHINYSFNANNLYHDFKCIRTPNKISYYVDGNLKHEVLNTGQNCSATGQDWFPEFNLNVILSQQILQPYNILGQALSPVTPQTTYFDYVKVKEFFLAPEITVSSLICSTATATLDVDLLATNITWQLTPSSLFTTLSGTGKVANIVKASGAKGQGKITYTFLMPSGESFTAFKDIFLGELPAPVITGVSTVKCGYDLTFKVDNLSADYGTSFYWDSDVLIITNDTSPTCKVRGAEDGNGYISCIVTACGVSKTTTKSITVTACMYLVLTPNPASDETVVTIESGTPETDFTATEWNMEVYDSNQLLKKKITKIKGKQTKISTNDWKVGTYFVRAQVGEEWISEKLVVSH